MNHEDLLDFQLREEDENVTNRRKINLINDITGIQKLMRQIVDSIQPSRSRISHNSPIKIYIEGGITYELVRYYISSRMNIAYVKKYSA